jgi:hypothetical protein
MKKIQMSKIELFLKELRESSDRMYDIFTDGSCARLFFLVKIVFVDAQLWWSDRDGHAVIRLDDGFYDIGGKINESYINNKEYHFIPEANYDGYKLLKYVEEGIQRRVTCEKYFKEGV